MCCELAVIDFSVFLSYGSQCTGIDNEVDVERIGLCKHENELWRD